jgi:hypothetical protein
VEREASAAAALVASMAAGRLHPAAVWSDLGTFDAGQWRGAVDCVLSGDPCQPNSVAGKRGGADDDRWLLDRVIAIFDKSGAGTLFRENNSPLQSRHWKGWAAALRSEFSARARPEPATAGRDCSSWPTVQARDYRTVTGNEIDQRDNAMQNLNVATHFWEALAASDQWRTPSDLSKRGGSQHPDKRAAGGHTINLEDQAEWWPTPMAGSPGTDSYNAAGNSDFSRKALALAEAMQWETPSVAVTAGSRMTRGGDRSGELLLTGQALAASDQWASPRATDGEKGSPNQRGSKGDLMLSSQTAQWPTPAARDYKGANSTDHVTTNGTGRMHMDQLPNYVQHAFHPSPPDQATPAGPPSSPQRRRLNPLFVEWLMGWPTGLSGFDTAEMASCPLPRPSPGRGCMRCWMTTQRAMLSALLTIDPPQQGQLL